MKQTNYPNKVFIIERLRNLSLEGEAVYQGAIGDIEYLFGYYIIGKIGNKNGKWTWGQYYPFIPKDDFAKILALAKKKVSSLCKESSICVESRF